MATQLNLNATSGFKNTPKYTISGRYPMNKRHRVPGPGTYKDTKTDVDKFDKTPSYKLGGSYWDSNEKSPLPGPGAHNPVKAGLASAPKWAFSSEPRLHEAKRDKTPDPGAYEVRGKMEGLQVSMMRKPEASMRSMTPGPGHYKPDATPLFRSTPKLSFGSSTRDEKKTTTRSQPPGPGKYDALTTLGGNITMRSSAKYTVKGRYDPPKADQTPGHIAAGTTFK